MKWGFFLGHCFYFFHSQVLGRHVLDLGLPWVFICYSSLSGMPYSGVAQNFFSTTNLSISHFNTVPIGKVAQESSVLALDESYYRQIWVFTLPL